MDALPDLSQLDQVGTVAICVLIVLAFMRGWIVSRREVDEANRQRDRAIDRLEKETERDETILSFLRAIKDAAERRSGSDAP